MIKLFNVVLKLSNAPGMTVFLCGLIPRLSKIAVTTGDEERNTLSGPKKNFQSVISGTTVSPVQLFMLLTKHGTLSPLVASS